MRFLRSSVWLGLAFFLIESLIGCGHADNDQASGESFFENKEYGTAPDVDYAPELPETRSENHTWIPDDRSVVWHFRDEARAQQDAIESALEVFRDFRAQYLMYAQFLYLRPLWNHYEALHPFESSNFAGKGHFIGLGRPFHSSQIHMFECAPIEDGDTRYLMEDYVFRCPLLPGSDHNTMVKWLVPSEASSSREDYQALKEHYSQEHYAIPPLAPRVDSAWYEFIIDVLEKTLEAHRPFEPEDCDVQHPTIEVYFYSEARGQGAEIEYPIEFNVIQENTHPEVIFALRGMRTRSASCRDTAE